ncbi:class II glutamine amidotransferase [Thermogladius sp. 4427co]|uniref:class II glutamine amidotransferase n=1 Tax=Thermogladius sp. 4427co TaxID=3450718 RepID=UPI003F79E90D
MAGIVRNPRAGYIQDFFNAFIESSRRDPYLGDVAKGYTSHDDGWGIGSIGLARSKPSLIYHRSILPLFHTHSLHELYFILRKMSVYDTIYFIIHARKASRGEPYGVEYTHPFKYEIPCGLVFFAHNGGIRKKDLAEKIGVNPWTRVDSDIAGLFIARTISECGIDGLDECIKHAYETLAGYTIENSALNTSLLVLCGPQVKLYASYYHPKKPEEDDQSLSRYYELIAFESEDYIIVSSSTLQLYLGNYRPRTLEEGLYEVTDRGVSRILRF